MKVEKSFGRRRPAKPRDYKNSSKRNKVNRISLNPTRGGFRITR